LLGHDWLRAGFKELGLSEPDLLKTTRGNFYATPAGTFLGSLEVVEASRDATIRREGDVAILEFHSKMNSLGEGVISMLHKAVDRVERERFAGLVIGNEDPRTFSAGADLHMVLKLIGGGDWRKVETAVRGFQETSLRLRNAPFPVVLAPFGLTLGGATEFSLYAD